MWCDKAQVDAGVKPDVTTDVTEDNRQLRRENAELRKVNENLKAASIFFAQELDRSQTK